MSSHARKVDGPWLDASVLNRTPKVRREFDLNRDPYIARQLADLKKTEKERREGSSSRGQEAGKKKDPPPTPTLKPPRYMRGDADREGWLLAKRDAALAAAARFEAKRKEQEISEHAPSRSTDLPQRGFEAPSR